MRVRHVLLRGSQRKIRGWGRSPYIRQTPATKEILAEWLGEIRSREIETAVKSPTSISLPSGPTQWLFERPPAESKF